MPAQAGQKGHERRALHEAGAERVRDGDVAGANGFHETGHAEHGVVAQFERIAKIIIDAAQDDIDAFEAARAF